jgi:hypothetical protein
MSETHDLPRLLDLPQDEASGNSVRSESTSIQATMDELYIMMTQVLTQQKKTYRKINKIQEEMSVIKEEVSFIKDELSITKRERIKRHKWQFEKQAWYNAKKYRDGITSTEQTRPRRGSHPECTAPAVKYDLDTKLMQRRISLKTEFLKDPF